jgi:hypothetical protein
VVDARVGGPGSAGAGRERAAGLARVLALAVVTVAAILVGACTAVVPDLERPDAAGAVLVTPSATPSKDVDDPSSGATPVADPDGVDATLESIATALRESDPDAVTRAFADTDGGAAERWRDRAVNLAGVPLSTYTLRLDREMPALTTSRTTDRWGADAQLVLVVEEHAFEGHDADGPRRDLLVLTVLPGDDGWLVADDQGGGALGLVRPVQLWDLGPVEATAVGGLLALHRPAAGGIDQLLDEAGRALDLARARWPLPWSERVPVLVPADADELRALLNVTFEVDEFVAFATATPIVGPDEHRMTGSRIVLNPQRFDGRDPATRELVLVHELLHIASRPYATTSTPLWLEEGVAQVLGEQRSATGTRLLATAGPAGRRLPLDAEFTTGGRDGIHLAYQRAWSFTDHLVARFGPERFARFYEAVGVGSAHEPGTVDHRLDQAARDILGAPLDELVATWRAS